MTKRSNAKWCSWYVILFAVLVVGARDSNAALASDKTSTAGVLQIYFIDVEGGQSTLVVTPHRHALLIDAGFPGSGDMSARPGKPSEARDANRIVAAARDAGVKQIDLLLITHFHPDHDGGVVELSQLLKIGIFVDHGSISPEAAKDPDYKAAFDAYLAVRGSKPHIELKPGDRLPVDDLDVTVVSSAGATLADLPGARGSNAACQSSPVPARDPYENPRSTGVVLRYGKFRFLDLGDLSGQPLFNLACPKSLIGHVDVYLVAHHGGPDADVLETFAAFAPRVAIMNNGVKKGGSLETYQALHQVRDLEDVWQLHLSAAAGDSNFDPTRVANLDETMAHWIKLVANADGSFRVLNPRTGDSKLYPPRRR